MKKLLFENWNQWKVCFMAGVEKFLWGFFRIITCIIFGVISLLYKLWQLIVGFVKTNPKISIGIFAVILFLTWLFTFTSMRVKFVNVEHQRDSLSYELSKVCNVNGDTSSLKFIDYNNHWGNE